MLTAFRQNQIMTDQNIIFNSKYQNFTVTNNIYIEIYINHPI